MSDCDTSEARALRHTCRPCGTVLSAESEEELVRLVRQHARTYHDVDLGDAYTPAAFVAMLRREQVLYWDAIEHLLPAEAREDPLRTALAPREREVAEYVVHGFTNRQIAERMGISERTVSTHLQNIFRKLDVTSRVVLTAMARGADRAAETALLPEDDPFRAPLRSDLFPKE
ncbi:MAG TPA: response regulator transcription factor [Trueperaceae bacterium]|nr:response regulator transcription factor [Trueperaceae bacterium]